MELTAEGARLAAALGEAFGAMARAVEELTRTDAARPLQVTLTPLFANAWLMPRLPDFLHANPGIELMLNPTFEVVELAPGGVDVAIRYGRGGWPGLEAEILMPADFVVVGAPELVRGRVAATAADLLDLPWLQELGTTEMQEWLRAHGVEGPPRGSVTHMPSHSMLEALRAGVGVTVAARPVVARDLAQGRLVEILAEPACEDGYWIVTRPGPPRPAARAFVAWLRRHAPRQVAAG